MGSMLLLLITVAGSAATFDPPSVRAPAGRASSAARHAAVSMGRADRRMAEKRKKGGGGPRGSPAGGRPDVVPRTDVLVRLGEVPVFGLKPAVGSGFLTAADGFASFWMCAREAEAEAMKLSDPSLRVEGLPLSDVYFDPKVRLKPADTALRELQTVPQRSRLDADIRVPLFCIDGLQTTDKRIGVESIPLFFSKAELIEFAERVYGREDAISRVLTTDLTVVVGNMLRGPAG